MKSYLYSYGLPFSEILGANLDALMQRVENNKASIIIIDGGVGEGKTTLLTECMDYVNKKHGLPVISLQDKKHPQLSMGAAQFNKHLKQCFEQGLPSCGYDEAGDFSKRGALSRINSMVNRLFETFRGLKILVGITLPNMNMLDSALFDNNIPRLLLHLKGRSNTKGNFSGYSLTQMNWIRYHFDKLSKGNRYICYDKVTPNFYGHFLDLEPERSKALDSISRKGKLEILDLQQVKMEGLLTIDEIQNQIMRSRTWCYQQIAKLKIQPIKRIGKSLFYEKDVPWRLEERAKNRKLR